MANLVRQFAGDESGLRLSSMPLSLCSLPSRSSIGERSRRLPPIDLLQCIERSRHCSTKLAAVQDQFTASSSAGAFACNRSIALRMRFHVTAQVPGFSACVVRRCVDWLLARDFISQPSRSGHERDERRSLRGPSTGRVRASHRRWAVHARSSARSWSAAVTGGFWDHWRAE
jgi:hypothetical protein